MAEDFSLEPRNRPSGPKSKATVSRILDASAALLDEIGFEALTTIRIAERAEVNIASLYSYFPNKYAVLSALSERMADRQLEWIRTTTNHHDDWQEALDSGLDAFVDRILNETGFAALSAAVRACPQLDVIVERTLGPIIELVASGLCERNASIAPRDALAVATVVVEAGSSVVNIARARAPKERKALIREVKKMLLPYLALHLK